MTNTAMSSVQPRPASELVKAAAVPWNVPLMVGGRSSREIRSISAVA